VSSSRPAGRRVEAILTDYIARRERGETPTPDEYYRLYPDLRDELRPWFEAYGFVSDVIAETEAIPITGPPERLGEFVLMKEIGRGSFGVVYLAEQPSLRRRVALKVLHPHVTLSERSKLRFRREARVAAGLNHPHIVPVHAVGEDQGHLYFVMAWVEGETLDQAVKRRSENGRGPEFWSFVTRVCAEVAEALEHAHAKGIIHRDLKPRNVLVSPEGKALLTDFGLARLLEEEGVSMTGDIFGTPGYMAPEQAAGRGRQAGPVADVYSLGAVLYECIAGRRPHPGEHPAEVLRNQILREPEPPRRTDPSIPESLETIALWALERDPAKRYQSAAELARDLRGVQAGMPVESPRRLRKALRRAGAAAALLLALGVGGAWWLRGHVVPEVEYRRSHVTVKARDDTLARMVHGFVSEGLAAHKDATLIEGRPVEVRLREEGGRYFLEASVPGPDGRPVAVEPVRYVSPVALPRHAGALSRRILGVALGRKLEEPRPEAFRLLALPFDAAADGQAVAELLRGAVLARFRETSQSVVARPETLKAGETPEAACDRLFMDGWLTGRVARAGNRWKATLALRRLDTALPEAPAFDREFLDAERTRIGQELIDWLARALSVQDGRLVEAGAKSTLENIAGAIEAARAGRVQEAQQLLEREVEDAVDPRAQARAMMELGSLIGDREPKRAELLFRKARVAYRNGGDEWWETAAKIAQGGVLLRLDPAEAQRVLDKALEAAQRLEDKLLQARALNNQGVLAAAQNRKGDMRSYFVKAAELFRTVGRYEDEAGVYTNLGWVELQSRDVELAQSRWERARRLARDCGSVSEQFRALIHLSTLAHMKKPPNKDDALRYAKLAVELSGDADPEARFVLGMAWWVNGEYREALAETRRALERAPAERRKPWAEKLESYRAELAKRAAETMDPRVRAELEALAGAPK
jgi:tetratricopeptide (TPR) repeat protein/predicted Ser/Thr protein kinase